MTTDVLFSVEKHVALITLNRPQALNALTLPMIQAMYQQLVQWQQDDAIHAVVVQAAEGKAFCAGGDVRWLYETGRNQLDVALSFFEQEYRLNQLIHDYPKPYVALMDGMTMGGGVGISLHGSHSVATERFVFAMPETTIGFFPDIGASYLLSRCPDKVGIYLGLTGHRLNALEALEVGLVKQMIQSSDVHLVLEKLIAMDLKEQGAQKITACLNTFVKPDAKPDLNVSISTYQSLISQCFSYTSMQKIVHALEKQEVEWTTKTRDLLKQRSPLSLCVTLRQLRFAETLSLQACLQMDRCLVRHFMLGHDFYEGVRALLVDKDYKPDWEPASLDLVQEKVVARYFEE